MAESKTTGPTSTASPEEVARFAAMAESWWDATGKFRPLHQLNPVRLAFIRDKLTARYQRELTESKPLDGLDLLDIGCGGGLLCEPMTRLGARVTGIDASEKNIGIARTHAAQSDLTIEYRSILPEDMVGEGRQFDVVLNMEVVEHVADLNLFLEACAALVKPGGVMFVATMNRTLRSLALAKIGAEYVLRWLPRGTHDWRKFLRPSELAAGLRSHRMRIEALAGMSYRPLSARWDISDDLSVNYLAYCLKEDDAKNQPPL